VYAHQIQVELPDGTPGAMAAGKEAVNAIFVNKGGEIVYGCAEGRAGTIRVNMAGTWTTSLRVAGEIVSEKLNAKGLPDSERDGHIPGPYTVCLQNLRNLGVALEGECGQIAKALREIHAEYSDSQGPQKPEAETGELGARALLD